MFWMTSPSEEVPQNNALIENGPRSHYYQCGVYCRRPIYRHSRPPYISAVFFPFFLNFDQKIISVYQSINYLTHTTIYTILLCCKLHEIATVGTGRCRTSTSCRAHSVLVLVEVPNAGDNGVLQYMFHLLKKHLRNLCGDVLGENRSSDNIAPAQKTSRLMKSHKNVS